MLHAHALLLTVTFDLISFHHGFIGAALYLCSLAVDSNKLILPIVLCMFSGQWIENDTFYLITDFIMY